MQNSQYVQAMAYELARELISAKIGNASHEIAVEETRMRPRAEVVAQLEQHIIALAREREILDPRDTEAVRDVIERYRRPNADHARTPLFDAIDR